MGARFLARDRTRSIALDSAKDAHMLMKNATSPSTVSTIAGFADRAVSTSLKPDARQLYKRNILDSLGCAISALPGAPFAALREQFAEYRSGGSCTLIGGGKTAPDQAALFNSGLVRYVACSTATCRQADCVIPVTISAPSWLLRSTQRRLARTSCLPLRSPMRSSAGSPP